MPPNQTIILSHLKWEETLYQRPQQLAARLSRRGRVLYVSQIGTRDFLRELLRGNRAAWTGRPNDNLIYVNIPYLPFTRYIGAFEWMKYRLAVALARFLGRRAGGLRDVTLWVYYPGYLPFLAPLRRHARRLVYDCMDQFSAFEDERPANRPLERRLLAEADIVFTGGKSLQRAKEGVNPRTYCFPSGVDFDHFHQAALDETPLAPEMRKIIETNNGGPILGYFGAIDERIDFDLIRYLCETRPDWTVVFIGPLIRFDAPPTADLANFHYLGKRPYADLPRFLKGFDVCLMPFVESELTRHISPTKTPEYLAGGKPVVSTPVPDVVEDYSGAVGIAGDYPGFAREIEAALEENKDAQSAARRESLAKARSWDQIAEEMLRLIDEAAESKGTTEEREPRMDANGHE